MDYSDFETWKGQDLDCNFGEEPKEDSWYLFQWFCSPLPAAFSGDQVVWFNDPYMMAGFVRHRLLWKAAMDMFSDWDEDAEEKPVEDILAAASENDEREYLREHLLHCLTLADEACTAPKDAVLPRLRECLAYYNEKFNHNPYGGWDEGADLVHGVAELGKFFPQQVRYSYSAEILQWIWSEFKEIWSEDKMQIFIPPVF